MQALTTSARRRSSNAIVMQAKHVGCYIILRTISQQERAGSALAS